MKFRIANSNVAEAIALLSRAQKQATQLQVTLLALGNRAGGDSAIQQELQAAAKTVEDLGNRLKSILERN